MPVYLDKNTSRLFIQFQFKGRSYKQRLPAGTTKTQAKEREVRLRNDLFFANRGEQQNELWEDFVCQVYLEHVDANHNATALAKSILICKASMPFFKGMLIRDIKPADVERFKTLRMNTLTQHGRIRKPATIHREISIISSIFSLAVKNDLCDYNPCSRVELPKFDNTQDRVLQLEDWQKFFEGFRNILQREVCETVLFTGLRQNDVLGLRKDQVNWQTGQIVLVQGKTRRKVRIDMNDTVRAILLSRIDNGHELFFPSYRNGKQMGSIRHGIQFACIRAGLEPLTMRDLRRSFGTTLHELGYDDSTTAQLLGHSDLRSIHRYKRGTAIKKEAVTALDTLAKSAKNRATPVNAASEISPTPLHLLVEMRRIELLASALRTDVIPTKDPYIH